MEAIKEAEEAALAEAEAAAAEAAEAMEGLFGDIDGPDLDDPGDGGTPESPSGTASQTGSQVDSRPLVDVVSGSGVMNPNNHGGSLVSVTASQKYIIRDDNRVRDQNSFSHSVDGVNNSNEVGDESERISLNSVPYRSEISLTQPHQGHSHHYPHYHHHHHHRGSGVSGMSGSGMDGGCSSRLSSLPTSPFVRRASKSNSFSSHVRLHEKYGTSKKPLVLFTYLDAQEYLPYADDSTAVTPKSELNGGIVVDSPTRMAGLSRKMSYNSHSGKVDFSYNSHENLRYPPSITSNTKEGILTKRMAHLLSDKQQQPCTPNSILFDPIVGGPEYPSQYGPNGSIDKMDLHQDIHNHRKCSTSGFMNNGKVDSVDIHVSFIKTYISRRKGWVENTLFNQM